ncbi:hypothetical protein FLONG3_4907 [Fusarium longipes]|uniref:Uncharacterized protein n=1 Tax=Fusarium longipes TaxID=694270 RepID=A0A395SXX9_9HYPO|nr:hypothetical protein FLONG3_4907 [Fusarium longipes]
MVGEVISLDWMEAAEKYNPVLSHAWLSFGAERKEIKEVCRDRERAINSLNVQGTSFEDFCNSTLMNEKLWSQFGFRIQDLHSLREDNQLHISRDDMARASLLELNIAENPDFTMEKMIQKAFGIISINGQEVLSIPTNPCTVRVPYQPNVCGSERLDINDLRSLQIPIWEQDMNEENVCLREVGKVDYDLLAVVHLKDDQQSHEYVRIYTRSGANIIAENELESSMNHSWSVKDSPGRYMIFYGLRLR